MNSYQKLKKENEILKHTIKKNDAELEFLSQNVDLTLNCQVNKILVPYLLRSNLKKQIEEIVWRGEIGGLTGKNNHVNEKFVVKSEGIISVLSEKAKPTISVTRGGTIQNCIKCHEPYRNLDVFSTGMYAEATCCKCNHTIHHTYE